MKRTKKTRLRADMSMSRTLGASGTVALEGQNSSLWHASICVSSYSWIIMDCIIPHSSLHQNDDSSDWCNSFYVLECESPILGPQIHAPHMHFSRIWSTLIYVHRLHCLAAIHQILYTHFAECICLHVLCVRSVACICSYECICSTHLCQIRLKMSCSTMI